MMPATLLFELEGRLEAKRPVPEPVAHRCHLHNATKPLAWVL